MPLSVSYRCPQKVVERARQWVSHIDPAPTAAEGVVRDITQEEFEKEHGTLKVGDAVLCRNTKPLVELAYQLIRKGIGAKVEGKDIGNGLVALAKRWKVRNVAGLNDKLDDYCEKQVQRLMAKGKEMQAQNLEDKVLTLKVIIGTLAGTASVADLIAKIQGLFGDTDNDKNKATTVILSTVHKSKGREWKRVYLYGRNRYMPSKYARQDWQRAQEVNLMYVAATRSQGELVEVAVNG
jgi:superfamily I DNA/RNA helicase